MIIISGASGGFGRAMADLLIDRVAPGDLVLTTRTPDRLAAYAARGATVRHADFDRPETLGPAFAGGTRMMLISTARVGTRVGQHGAAIDAAVATGVRHICYTSIVSARVAGNPALVKQDHCQTEELIEASGAAWTFLRDSQYAEAVAGAMVPGALAHGRIPDNSHDGQIAFVSRQDCVAVAAEIMLQPGHERQAYDLTGPELMTVPGALAMAAQIAGRPIVVEAVDDAGMFAHFDAIGVPRHATDDVPDGPIPWCSEDMVTFGQSIREGYFAVQTDHVERITGRKATPLRDVMLAHRAAWPT
jgi:NAD(P)H dehydrogenase (quinone)